MKGLLLTRIRKDYNYQYGILKTAIDWTVIVYFILPVLFFTGLFYRSLWIEPPDWFNWFDWRLAALVIALSVLSSRWRTFLYEADSVFLIKRRNQVELILKKSFIYNLVFSFMETGIVIVLLLPFLINFLSVSWLSVFALWIAAASLRVSGKALFYFSWLRFKGWALQAVVIVIGIVLFIGAFPFVWLSFYVPFAAMLPLIILMAILPVLLKNSLLSANRILDHGLKEREYKTRLIKKMFSMSYEVETPPKAKTRSKPWLFGYSQKIFKNAGPKQALAELFIKHYARDREFTYHIMRFFGASGASGFFVPTGWGYLIIVSFLAFGTVMVLGQMWAQLIDQHAIGGKYKARDAYFKVRRIFNLIVIVPYLIFAVIYFI
ncbi:ABC transporter permease [Jeotgalibacillus terrae]|uniref:ABC transporter permease n=1 Tax=Jeotgalibacillus terrae TaxID=587735 RepID=A0ABW5ZIA5_9BACL|nr:ABC transporter permease [Jeotgalibacillus terrae]MBM7579000.1 ABC-2 type transport system permease protein [Jeotgalibacillus terrae]